MDAHSADVEPVTLSEILNLDTWNRPRSSEELQRFIRTRHDRLPDDVEIE